MNAFRNLSLGKKLYSSFRVVVLLLAVVFGVAYWGMSALASSTHTITNVAEADMVAGDDLKFAAADLNGSQTQYIVDRGKSRGAYARCAGLLR